MRTFWTAVLAAASAVLLGQGSDPFVFYGESLELTAADRARLAEGRAIVKTLPHGERELAIFAAVQADVPGARLVEWVRAIEALKQSARVPAVGRFSDPPRIEDLANLELDAEDLGALRSCRPGSCGVKLSADEIARIRQVIADAGGDWREAVQQTFRTMMLARVESYRRHGLTGAAPYHDQRDPTPLDVEFEALLESSPYLTRHVPQLVSHFAQGRQGGQAGQGRQGGQGGQGGPVESFLYWSKETLGGKPIIALTHVAIATPGGGALPEALVASRQFYATHYMTGALALTAIVGGSDGRPRYLAYLNRSRVDVLGGLFGGVARRIIGSRLRGEATEVVEDLRRRLESGTPRPAGG